jgi:NAD(P)-dependent dehydrogenase (short-subunit alcohol dehydrogenase family)
MEGVNQVTFREDALSGQHIIISGGCGALGVVIIQRLTEHGASVTVNDILNQDIALERLTAGGVSLDRVSYVQADLTIKDGVKSFVDGARQAFGPIHTALCHAGVVMSRALLDVEAEDWDKTLAINTRAAFLLGQAAARAMLEDGIPGQLIFTTSWVAAVPWPEIGPYSASKAAMNQLMRSFARELAEKGIRCNAIAPGIVGAGMAKQQWDTDPSYKARAQKAVPLGFLQPPDSVADAFLFMCSPASSYMTGSVLLVDGGCSLYPMD